jgi:hypothetical protein
MNDDDDDEEDDHDDDDDDMTIMIYWPGKATVTRRITLSS